MHFRVKNDFFNDFKSSLFLLISDLVQFKQNFFCAFQKLKVA